MADASLSHSTASPQNQGLGLDESRSDSTSISDPAAQVQPSPVANLPLRQSLRQPVPNVDPKYHDITEKFTEACNGLKTGQLVKDDFFTLFESIGAIEIMDPKMDSGFLQPGESPEDDYDTLTPILPEELIRIMDQLLCHEMAWHTGYPLSQTLFTSVYIDKLLWPATKILEEAQFYRDSIPEDKHPGPLLQVLRAYCLALIKGCDFVIAKITGRDYYEEEDFCTHTYNRVLFVKTPMDVFLRELDAAMEILDDTDLNINDAARSAIVSRLNFRKNFVRALDLDLPLNQIAYSWPLVLEDLSMLKTTHQLGKVVPGAFSTKMQRRLASTVPPRPIVELEFKDAVEKLQQLCNDCQEATRFINLQRDPLEYQSFMWYFAARSPPPLGYARAYLATLLFNPDILETSTSLPLMDVTALVFPASPVLDPVNWTHSPPRNELLPKPPQLQLAILIDEFVERSGQPYLDFWVALGQNRCRLRRMLTHVITGWDLLQSDASLIDADVSRALEELGTGDQALEFSLATWVYNKKLWMVEKVVLLSFEQDIYLPDEFASMYFFLSYIASQREQRLLLVDGHFLRRHDQLVRERNFRKSQDVEEAWPYVASLLLEVKGIMSLSLGLARFYTILLYLNLLPIPKRPSSGDALRYELRMKPFLNLQPSEVLPFESFKRQSQLYGDYSSPDPSFYTDLHDPQSELWTTLELDLKVAKHTFSELKKLGAQNVRAEGSQQPWNSDVQSCLASCVALSVAVAGVKDAVVKNASKKFEDLGIKVEVPELGKRYNEGWVVVKVSKV